MNSCSSFWAGRLGRGQVCQPFFCAPFVVYVYQWAAQQSGISPEAVFSLSDAKATPSLLASKLIGNSYFSEEGYMLPNER